ncbi:MAG: tripartite tricarboxylate transporter TctB family protein [Pseudomonadota bacterium]|nr:tripartite tricarboxylate transporter TctB family protein [Pseudomonadota bacterium]
MLGQGKKQESVKFTGGSGSLIFTSGPSGETMDIPKKSNIFRIICVSIIICIYILTFNILGYLISTSLSLILFMAFFGLRDFKYFALLILTIPPAIYYLFKKLLYVPFPVGLWFWYKKRKEKGKNIFTCLGGLDGYLEKAKQFYSY